MQAHSGERAWVARLGKRLALDFSGPRQSGIHLTIETNRHVPYGLDAMSYVGNTLHGHFAKGYQTDLLISDHWRKDGADCWAPRVVIECKLSEVSTHDALTYSAKAATHKHVHPYLRYGFLIGHMGGPIPWKLFRHGTYFDFIIAWKGRRANATEWPHFLQLLREEVSTARMLAELMTDRSRARKVYQVFHRPVRAR